MALSYEILDTYTTWSCTMLFTASTSNILTCATAHGLEANDIIRVYISAGTPPYTLPAPLQGDTNYYVLYINATTFKLSLTAGGSEIDITTTGSGTGVKFRLYRSVDYKMFTAATSNIITSNSHGLVEGDTIVPDSNSALPAPLTSRQYYVKYIDSNTFYLSLTEGGDTIDITDTGTGSHWWKLGNSLKFIRDGSLITNNTRAGYGILIQSPRLSFNAGDLTSVRILTISGSFVALDECSTENGGSFMITAVTSGSTTTDTIVVNGIDETDTTQNLNGNINASVTTVAYTPTASALSALRYIKIDSEWMYVISADTTSLLVKRGVFGTTAASHTSGADIYILEEDLPRAIIDKDAAEGWGYCSMASGKFEINVPLILGRPDQTSNTLLLTTMDKIECDNLYICGNPTYGTIFQSGLGWVDSGEGEYQGLYFNGSNLSTLEISAYDNSTLNLYGGTVLVRESNIMYSFGAANIMSASISCDDVAQFVSFTNVKPCKMYKSWINNQRVSGSSVYLDWLDVYENYKVYQESVYFLSSGGDTTFRSLQMVDPQYSANIFAFAAGGTKTFIDCEINEDTTMYLAGILTIHKKTVNINVISQDGAPIEGVNIKIYDKNMVEVSDVSTDVNGNIVEQEVMYKYLDNDYVTMIDNNPFTFFISKAGWREQNFTFTMDAPVDWSLTMYDYELDDDIKYR